MRRAGPSRRTSRTESAEVPASRSDAAWEAMTAIEADATDRWSDIEEHLLRSQHHDIKRWKYFAK